VDATIVEVPIQRNTCDENKVLKEGNIIAGIGVKINSVKKIPTRNGLPIMEEIILDIRIIPKQI
jgi:hypothetical protein